MMDGFGYIKSDGVVLDLVEVVDIWNVDGFTEVIDLSFLVVSCSCSKFIHQYCGL